MEKNENPLGKNENSLIKNENPLGKNENPLEKNENTSEKIGKTGSKRKDILIFLLSFLTPVLGMAFIWGAKGITYGGVLTPLVYDLRAQYMPLIAGLRYVLEDPGALFYSWNVSLGGNFMGTFAYYLACPLNWITVLFDLENMPDAIYVLTLLKTGLCGLSFSAFLRFGPAKGRSYWYNIVFACCYALMSYNIIYGMCLMWTDAVILTPLILLGIEKLLEGKKGLLYLISIAAVFFCNYYISYMVGIFAGAYLLCRIFMQVSRTTVKKYLAICLRFGVCTILAAGFASPLLIPAVLNLSVGKRQLTEHPQPEAYQFTVMQLWKKFLPQQYETLGAGGLPSVFCGSIILILVIVFFLQKGPARRKVGFLLLAFFPFLGFCIPQVDFFWHGFHYPAGFPYRYAFLFSTVLLIMAYYAFLELDLRKSYISLLLVLGLFYTCAELFLNGSVIIGAIHKEGRYSIREAYDMNVREYRPLAEELGKDKKFYRVGGCDWLYSTNDPFMYGINGVTWFSSCYNEKVNVFLRQMGCLDYSIRTTGQGATPFLESLLGIRYRIDTSDLTGFYRKKTGSRYRGRELVLYENPDALSLGYMVDKQRLFWNGEEKEDVFLNQNRLAQVLGTGNTEIFREAPFELKTEETDGEMDEFLLEFKAPSDSLLYLYFSSEIDSFINEEGNDRTFTIYVDGEARHLHQMGYMWYSKACVLLGRFRKGETHTVRIEGECDEFNGVWLYEFREGAYRNILEQLKRNQLLITEFSSRRAAGTITADGEQILFTTIPYDRGYTVLVDGQAVDYGKALDTFLCIELPAGQHSVEITYTPPGWKEGVCAFAAALILGLGYFSCPIKRLLRLRSGSAYFLWQK